MLLWVVSAHATDVFVIATDGRMFARHRRQIRRSIGYGLQPGFFIDRHGDDMGGKFAVGALFVLQCYFLAHKQNVTHLRVKIRIATLQIVLCLDKRLESAPIAMNVGYNGNPHSAYSASYLNWSAVVLEF